MEFSETYNVPKSTAVNVSAYLEFAKRRIIYQIKKDNFRALIIRYNYVRLDFKYQKISCHICDDNIKLITPYSIIHEVLAVRINAKAMFFNS